MNTALRAFGCLIAGSALLSALPACEVECDGESCIGETLQVTNGDPVDTDTVAWADGQTVRVENFNGDIKIVAGADDEIRARCRPSVARAASKDDEAQADLDKLVCQLVEDGGKLKVDVTINGTASSTLSADVSVFLPTNFNARLEVLAENGDVQFDYTGDTSEFSVLTENGSIEGSIDKITGDMGTTHAFQALGAGADIALTMPTSTEQYIIFAAAAEGASIETPSECSTEAGGELAFTTACNGAAVSDTVTPVTYSFDACEQDENNECDNAFGEVVITY